MIINNQNYRPEIDGLRAIAVLSVMFCHAHIPFFSGGFIGVDIFFVISGYLITGIIYRELQDDSFSILNFYERRIRRILPSLLFMTIIIFVISYKYLLPSEFSYYARSLSAMASFLANIFFLRNVGYFDIAADSKPLLHTWSLSVEEQFYICLPLILIIIYKYKKRYLPTILGILFLLSFIASSLSIYSNQDVVFYLLQYRSWELLAGSILATWPKLRDHQWKKVSSDVLSAFSLVIIAASVYFYDNNTVFPGLAAAPAIVGTVIIIQLGVNGFMGKILSLPIFVFIGKISYPLYLWHWPLLVILRIHLNRSLLILEIIMCLLISILLSILSWYIIERPIRSKHILKKQRSIFVLALTFIILFSVGGRMIMRYGGLPYRFSHQIVSFLNNNSPNRLSSCMSNYSSKNYITCILGAENASHSDFILWGDSHAAAWAPGIDKIAKEFNISGIQYAMSGCVPVFNYRIKPEMFTFNTNIDQRISSCLKFNDGIVNLIKQYNIKHVILAATFGTYLGGRKRKLCDPRVFTDEYVNFSDQLNNTIKILNDLKVFVWIVEDVPEYDVDVLNTIIRTKLAGEKITKTVLDYKIYESFYWPVEMIINDITNKNKNVRILKIEPPICNELNCIAGNEHISYYFDENHLSPPGAIFFKNTFKVMMESIFDD
ncbi:MAG: acyltransferase [Rickettsiales bacterium]|jgi:peptidoglycan/LPS O-acetylase OafA/YrhL|nr:acyltransferase [Rickettsiales bacterium]